MIKSQKSKYYKFLLFVIFILRYPISKNDQNVSKMIEQFQKDLIFCPDCFINQVNECDSHFYRKFVFDETLVESLNNLFGVKIVRYGRFEEGNGKMVVVKYLGNSEKFNYVLGGVCGGSGSEESCAVKNSKRTIEKLEELFFDKNRIDGCQFCPAGRIKHFLHFIRQSSSEEILLNVWVHLIVNIQSLLFPLLNSHNFPVPKFYKSCGFTIFESYEGVPLIDVYSRHADIKLEISSQLLKAAFQFTNGIEGYRIYLTDITPDNIAYNEKSKRISFIDLDNILIVDSEYYNQAETIENPPNDWSSIHKHNIIECEGCFAYVPSEICSHYMSDLNLFAVCQLLREDLYGNRKKGFLYPFYENSLKLGELLDECVDCGKGCTNRFESAKELLKEIEKIIEG